MKKYHYLIHYAIRLENDSKLQMHGRRLTVKDNIIDRIDQIEAEEIDLATSVGTGINVNRVTIHNIQLLGIHDIYKEDTRGPILTESL